MKRSIARSMFPDTPKAPKLVAVLVAFVSLLASSTSWNPQQTSASVIAAAAAGELDQDFGTGGKVTTDFLGFGARAYAVAIQSDGKIVTAGVGVDNSHTSGFALARFTTGGAFDTTFGIGGRVLTAFGGLLAAATSIGLQADGKIVAAGTAADPISFQLDFALARYNPDGSLDSTFGIGGKVVTDFSSNIDESFALAIQNDGKIVVAGVTTPTGSFNDDFAISRYNNDGSLDQSFGSGGRIATDFYGSSDQANGVVIQSDGKIVAVGEVTVIVDNRFFNRAGVARYNSDGSADATFGTGGQVVIGVSGAQFFSRFNGVALQRDGKIVATGIAFNPTTRVDFGLVRLTANGSLDSTFGVSGKVTTDFFGIDDVARSVVLQPDGKIIAAGFTTGNPGPVFSQDFSIARYNRDGSLDTTFGNGGKVATDFFGDDNDGDVCNSLALQRDGKIVAAGSASKALGEGSAIIELALARYNWATFDVCIQDESNGNLLEFNSNTGEYLLENCGKDITLTGVGKVTNDPYGCKVILQDTGPVSKRPDRNVNVLVNRCTRAATASIQILSTGLSFSIADSDITNNTCRCGEFAAR